jgi:hypothetical protein
MNVGARDLPLRASTRSYFYLSLGEGDANPDTNTVETFRIDPVSGYLFTVPGNLPIHATQQFSDGFAFALVTAPAGTSFPTSDFEETTCSITPASELTCSAIINGVPYNQFATGPGYNPADGYFGVFLVEPGTAPGAGGYPDLQLRLSPA